MSGEFNRPKQPGVPKREDFGLGRMMKELGIPRTHQECIRLTGVARPGKTPHDKFTGAWKSKAERRQRAIERQQRVWDSSGRKRG